MILITGANGQLGRDFQQLLNALNLDYIATHHTAVDGCQALDITDRRAVEQFLSDKEVDTIINCAAYNQVDKAEEEPDKAFALNREAPKHLAEIARKKHAVFVTYSTDFVFDGEQQVPYTESDRANPLNVYGESKLQGEQAVLEAYDRVYVIRTSWVFGMGNHNFNRSVIQWSKTKEVLNVVDDQISAPTYSKDLAEYSWELLKTGRCGLYHLSNNGEASKYDQAKAVLDYIGWNGELLRGKTSDFPLPARRALYTKLDCTKAEQLIGRRMPHWWDGIDRFMKEMKETREIR